MIIDAHVHTYPTAAIGQQALQGAGRSGCSGTVEELVPVMARGKISYAVMANMTPTYDMKTAALKNLPPVPTEEEKRNAEQKINAQMIERMKRRNLWSCTAAKENPKLIPLISVDILQTSPEMQEEIEDKAKIHGARGLKLHPVANRFYPYDRRLWPAYAKAMEMNFPILFHSGKGDIAGYTEADYARPQNFEPVLQSFPQLKIILAHLGKGFLQESAAISQKYDNLFFDTSALITGVEIKDGFASNDEAVKFMRTLGINKVLFGSDWPWFDPLPAIEKIKTLNLTPEEKVWILGKNAAAVYGLM